MDEAKPKTHVLMQDCIIGEIGRCEAGLMISESDVVQSTWQWLQERNFLKSVAEIELEADSEAGDVPGQPEAGDGGSVQDAAIDLLTRVRAMLADGNQRKSDIIKATGCDEATLTGVLIEANGIEHKGGGWYSLKPVPPAE